MNTKPRRRWFSFTLRTLFVLTTIVGCWCGYQLNWIRQRHAMLELDTDDFSFDNGDKGAVVSAPWYLAMFGERGVVFVVLQNDERKEEVKAMFPEALCIGMPTFGRREP